MREWVTTGLDVLGVLTIATGVGFAAVAEIGPAGVAAAGVVMLVAVRVHDWLAGRQTSTSLDIHVRRLWDRAGELTNMQRDRLVELVKLRPGDRQ